MNEELILIHSAEGAKQRFRKTLRTWLSDLEGVMQYVRKTFGVVMDDELLHAALTHYDYFAARLRSLSTTGSDKLEDWLSTAKDRYLTVKRAGRVPVIPKVIREGDRLRPVVDPKELEEALQEFDTYADMLQQGDHDAYKAINGLVKALNRLLAHDPDLRAKVARDPGPLREVLYFDDQTAKIDPYYFRSLAHKLDRGIIGFISTLK